MAVYRLSASIIGRSSGRSATAAAAYRSGQKIEDLRTGETHDYTRRSGVLHSEILTPENTPDWMHDRAQLWNAVEAAEKRKDAQLAREILLSLPHELTDDQRRELVRDFVKSDFVARGMIADLSIHLPDREGDNRNHHAHVMLTMRELAGDGFAAKKQRDWNGKDVLEGWRERWAEHQNARFRDLGFEGLSVDHRSVIDRGDDYEPEPKLGPHNSKLQRVGLSNDQIAAWRQARADRQELRRIDAEIARFETWAAARKNDLEREKLDATRELEHRHDTSRAATQETLDRFYGADRQKAESGLSGIQERQERVSEKGWTQPLRQWWYGLSGQKSRDQDDENLHRSHLADIDRRSAEQMGKLDQQQAAERQNLGSSFERRAEKQAEAIDQTRAQREGSGWQPPDWWRNQEQKSPEASASHWWNAANSNTPQPSQERPTDMAKQEKPPKPERSNER